MYEMNVYVNLKKLEQKMIRTNMIISKYNVPAADFEVLIFEELEK